MRETSRVSEFIGGRTSFRILFIVTFSFIFLFHTFPLGLSDFWWHMNTGRWIWEHGALPVDDPFLYSSVSPLDVRATQILRGYPLFQLLIFGVYSLAGAYALVVLKGLLMTLFYGLLWSNLRRNGMHSCLALAVVGALPLLFFRFDDFRPQIFTFIFTMLVLQLIENIIVNERRGVAIKPYMGLLLPVIMLLWANLHGGFIIGVAILSIYWASEWIARKRNVNSLSDEAYKRLFWLTCFSVGAALLNPAGMNAIWSIFFVVSGPFSKVIDEYLSTISYFEFHGIKLTGYLIVATAIIPAIALLGKWRELSIPHIVLLVSFLAAGIMSFRFSLLMVAMVSVIASAYFSRGLSNWMVNKRGIQTILFFWLASTIFLANSALSRTSLSGSPLEAGAFPTPAIDYLGKSELSGNIYNFFEYGGYLSWALYPQKIFTDQRGLSWDVYEEYSQVWRGEYDKVFSKYDVGVVLYPIFEGNSGKVSRLSAGLLADQIWGVGYYDGRDIVFAKIDKNAGLGFIDKQAVIRDLIKRTR